MTMHALNLLTENHQKLKHKNKRQLKLQKYDGSTEELKNKIVGTTVECNMHSYVKKPVTFKK